MDQDTRVDELLSRWQAGLAHGQDLTAADLCAACPDLAAEVARRLDALRQMQGLLETQDPAATADLAASAPAGVAAPVTLPGYEIMGELGRGGMGVVYQARHRALKRLVALKVILSAGQAAPGERTRFRVEAEAVARLQHPNIVQIHEVGEQAGAPFCVLEFVDGGSLAQKLEKQRYRPDEAARLAETLARAMHYAHHEGKVLHRDLKPANVLLTAAGEPKITDFGLAKHLDDDSGQTRTGDVIGTPSYMAPEQAAGDLKAVGPRTDVYALGAILYELLTGRPPFKGPNVAVTLQQVQGQDPTPPTRLNPKTPRALETICLKCLAKDPAHRYASALQLAQDLERFRGGESILARPEGLLGKTARKLRRRWPLVAAGLAVAAALAVAWVAFSGGRHAWRASELGQQIEAGLAAAPADWSGGHVEQQEARIAELATLAPQQADGWREQLHHKFREAVAARIDQPRLEAEERDRIEGLLRAYAGRWPDEEPEVRAQFRRRLRDWQELCVVAAPFTGWEAALPAADVTAEKDSLLARPKREPTTPPVVLTTAHCEGGEEIEATWDESWTAAPTLGMRLNTEADGRGYAFLLTTGSCFRRQEDPPAPTTLADAIRADGLVYAQIWRDGFCLREETFAAPAGPLTLRAHRQGDQVDFQAGAAKPVAFVDAFPPPPSQGYQGLCWPVGPRLVSLKCRRQTLPQAPSPLERADELFARGRHAEALAAYEQGAATAGPEARYKAALCLVEVNRLDEAADRLERVAGESGERWPILAAFRLWLMRLQQKRADKAEEVFQGLAARIRPEDVALYLPVQSRTALAQELVGNRWGVNALRANEEMVHQAEETVRGVALLQPSPEALGEQYRALIRIRWMVGQTDQATKDADGWIQQCEQVEPPPRRVRSACFVLLDRSWLARTGRQPETRPAQARKALEELDRWRAPYGPLLEANLSEQYARCLAERARLQIAIGDWAGAEKDLATCVRLAEDPAHQVSYSAYCDIHLLDGFVRQRRNDEEGTRQAWRKGTLDGYRLVHPEAHRGQHELSFFDLYMALKTGEVEDAEIARILDDVLASSSDPTTSQAFKLAGLTPATFRHALQSARCDDFLRRFALGELSFPEVNRGPARLLGLEVWRDGAFGGNLSADQEAVLWPATDDLLSLYASNGGAKRQFMQLGLTWLGSTGFLGWGSVAPELKPELRGPLAYVMGHRLLSLQKPAQAEGLFRTAVADAPPDSLLHRLAGAELERLKK